MEWISIKDQLPTNPNIGVLAIDVYGLIRIAEYCDEEKIWWFDQNFEWEEVTHWMPLPLPPKK